MTLLLTFLPSFFEQNVSVQLKVLRFSAIFVISKESQKCGTFSQKCGNAGNKPKCGISRTIAGRLTPMISHYKTFVWYPVNMTCSKSNQIKSGVKCICKLFELSNGLDTALYKNIPFFT